MPVRFPVHATGCSAHASSKGIRRRRKAKQAYYEELRELESSPDEEDVHDEEQHDGGAIYHPRFWVLYFWDLVFGLNAENKSIKKLFVVVLRFGFIYVGDLQN